MGPTSLLAVAKEPRTSCIDTKAVELVATLECRETESGDHVALTVAR